MGQGPRSSTTSNTRSSMVFFSLFLRNGVSFNLRMISPPSSTLWRDRNQLIIKPLRQPQREALTKSASSGHFTKLAERTLRIHRDLILNYFKAKKVISS